MTGFFSKFDFFSKKVDYGSVLIVDDDPEIRDIVKTYVESLGLFSVVVQAENGQDALWKIGNQSFDLILLDLDMPKKDGIELLQELSLKDDKDSTVVNIVIMSGTVSDLKLGAALTHGVKHYLIKPFNRNLFKTKIKDFIQTKTKSLNK